MKTFVSIILLVSTFSFSQNQNKIDLEKLKTKVYQLVNEERSNNDRKLLGLDDHLKKAADDHAKYIAKIQSLSHEQSVVNKVTPKERVNFYGGNSFVLIGENLLFIGILDKPYSEKDLDALALKMFNLWKNSANHYKNISETEYNFTEIGFSIDWENKKIYAVQLFGTK